jgi:hypothetical protein
VAAIEVKNREGLSAELAATFRRNILTHSAVSPKVPFFLLISQESGFLWKGTDISNLDALPNVEFSMVEIVRKFGPKDLTDRLRHSELETIVFLWLATLAESSDPVKTEPELTLASSGFLAAIQGAFLSREAA